MAHINSRVTFNNVPIDKLKVAMVLPMPNSQVLIEDQIKTEIQNSQSDSSDQIKKLKNENCCDVCGKYFKRKWALDNHTINCYRYPAELSG